MFMKEKNLKFREDIPFMLQNISTKSNKIKRVLISDFKDPVTVTISLVKAPCVSEAVFIEVIQEEAGENMTELQDQINEETNSFLEKINGLFKASTKEEQEKTEEKEEEEKTVEYVTKEELNEVRSELLEELTTQIGNMKTEILEAIKPKEEESSEKEEKEEEVSEKECKDKEEEKSSEKEDTKTEEEKTKKASSKSKPHHGQASTKGRLSETATVYKLMGRDKTGSRIKQ